MVKITFLQASTLFTNFNYMLILHRFEKYCWRNRLISFSWHYNPTHTISLQKNVEYIIMIVFHQQMSPHKLEIIFHSRPKKWRRRMDIMNMKMILRSEDSFWHFLLKAWILYISYAFPICVLISVYILKKHPYTIKSTKLTTSAFWSVLFWQMLSKFDLCIVSIFSRHHNVHQGMWTVF